MILSTLFLLLGCSTPCDKAAEVMVAIGDVPADKKGDAAEGCESQYEKPEDKAFTDAIAACVDKTGDEQKTCAYTVKVERSANKARAEKDWSYMTSRCKEYGTLVPACDGIVKEAIGEASKELLAIRDKGEDSIKACVELKGAAEAGGPEAVAAAEALCEEAEASAYAAEGMAQAKANAAANKADMPIRCSMALEKLQALNNDWAKGRAKEAAQGCYVDLGEVILAAEVPKMKYSCSYHAQQVYDVVKAYDLHDPELDVLMAKADGLCAKKG